LNTTVDLRSNIDLRYAHQTVTKPKSEYFLPAGQERALNKIAASRFNLARLSP
jgi:hypothetical protein